MTTPTAAKPIETHYAGCRFRSRLEARWAVLFDHLHIRWQYEPQGYFIGSAGVPYLPDFYLPDQQTWVEVKGDEDDLDFDLLVAAATRERGLPLSLDPGNTRWPVVKLRMVILGVVPAGPMFHLGLVAVDDLVGKQMVTPLCVSPVEPNLRHGHEMVPISTPQELGVDPETGRLRRPIGLFRGFGFGFPCSQIDDAYQAARSARFEHGESG